MITIYLSSNKQLRIFSDVDKYSISAYFELVYCMVLLYVCYFVPWTVSMVAYFLLAFYMVLMQQVIACYFVGVLSSFLILMNDLHCIYLYGGVVLFIGGKQIDIKIIDDNKLFMCVVAYLLISASPITSIFTIPRMLILYSVSQAFRARFLSATIHPSSLSCVFHGLCMESAM